MSKSAAKKRDRDITRQIHKLFWEANLHKKLGLVLCYIFRFPAFTCTHVLMPVTVAYGLQAIVGRDFDSALISLIVLTFVIFFFEFVATRFFVLFGPF